MYSLKELEGQRSSLYLRAEKLRKTGQHSKAAWTEMTEYPAGILAGRCSTAERLHLKWMEEAEGRLSARGLLQKVQIQERTSYPGLSAVVALMSVVDCP
ncbi:hypothetical protein A2752_03745 [Candidatus Uhrbacteria bacterium RIFCSPHIGHO2_01_FULL_46_23]|nr:MAG: hypothetical protein A2752_03745 [Candidatus Uhrbacteria bacterium RIFCSPHIGHO2_01_FULL_46_23]